MADLKISALPASTVPLAGTEILPIVQSSATKQVTVANLTAGRAVATGALTVTGDATLSNGNLVISTSGKGIDFSATPGTGTSELLADYEEGTWTPTLSSSGATFIYTASTGGTYVKVGNVVTVHAVITISSHSGGTGGDSLFFANLPFTPGNTDVGGSGTGIGIWCASYSITLPVGYSMFNASVKSGASVLPLYSSNIGGGFRMFQYSDISAAPSFQFSLTYQTT
jgi:hypothetical protein